MSRDKGRAWALQRRDYLDIHPQFGGAPRAMLPLPEGVAALEIPPVLSKKSHGALKAWVSLMVQLAEANICEPIPPSSEEEHRGR